MFGRYLRGPRRRRAARSTPSPRARSATPANGADLLASRRSGPASSIARAVRRGGGAARLRRRRQLDHARRRRGARPRRRQPPAHRGRRAPARSESGSWPLGAVRVTEQQLASTRPSSRKQLKQARAAVREQLGGAAGSPTAAAGSSAWAAPSATSRPPRRAARRRPASRATCSSARARRARGRARQRPASQRALPGIKAARADIVLGRRASCSSTVLELGGFDGIEVTRAGLREGVFFSAGCCRALAAARRRARRLDPQPRAAVRRRHRPRRPRRAARAAAPRLARGRRRLAPAPGERELLWAAALLHDVGMTIGYDGHPTTRTT